MVGIIGRRNLVNGLNEDLRSFLTGYFRKGIFTGYGGEYFNAITELTALPLTASLGAGI